MSIGANWNNGLAYAGLYGQCIRALRTVEAHGIYVSWMMAICLKESKANPFFLSKDVLLKENLDAMPFTTVFDRKKWIEFITVNDGPHKGRIPKFRFEPAWLAEFEKTAISRDLSKYEQLIHCCSWGMPQKSGLYYLAGFKPITYVQEWREYCSDVDLQLQVLAEDLMRLRTAACGNIGLIFSKYNSGPSAVLITDYARICLDYVQGFGQQIAAAKLAQDIDDPVV